MTTLDSVSASSLNAVVLVKARIDEFLPGRIGRYRMLNGHPSNLLAFQDLIAKSAALHEFPHLLNDVLCNNSDKTSCKKLLETWGETDDFRSMSNNYGFTSKYLNAVYRGMIFRKGGYACTECAAEDLEQRGFSYWRKIHQFPGVYWCINHDMRSLVHFSRRDPFEFCPHTLIKNTETYSPAWSDPIEEPHRQLFEAYTSAFAKKLQKDSPNEAFPFSPASMIETLKNLFEGKDWNISALNTQLVNLWLQSLRLELGNTLSNTDTEKSVIANTLSARHKR